MISTVKLHDAVCMQNPHHRELPSRPPIKLRLKDLSGDFAAAPHERVGAEAAFFGGGGGGSGGGAGIAGLGTDGSLSIEK